MKTLIQQSLEFDKKLLAIPLKECGEPLVALDANVPIRYGLSACPIFRMSVARALSHASKDLNKKGYTLVLFDGYRSISIQKQKFFQFVHKLKQRYPNMNTKELSIRANMYIAGIPILAAHTSGAAVDVGIADKQRKLLDMGTAYYTGSYKSETLYSGISKQARANRLLLKTMMEQAGFTNYPFEWWHYSLGDVCAAYCSHAPKAIYGPVEYDKKNNKTLFLLDSDLYTYFKK